MKPRTGISDRSPSSGKTRRIRVLWLIKGLGRGGAEMLLYHAAALRDREQFDCEVGYLLESRSWLADELRSTGVPVNLFAADGRFDFSWTRGLRRFLLERPVDVLHVHSPFVAGISRLVVRSLPRRIRPILISTEHLPWSGHALPTRILNGTTFPMDDAHIVVSQAVLGSIPRMLRGNILALNHGIPLEAVQARRVYRDTVRRELGVQDDEIVVGTVANDTPQKAHADLIEAAGRLIEAGRRVRVVIAGRGTHEGALPALRDSLGLGDLLILLGPVEDAPRLMSGFDVFTLASHWEGLPLVIMEAMAIGLPIVATRVGGVPELVRDGIEGLLVPKGRPDLLAQSIDELTVDGDRRKRMGRAAAESAGQFDNKGAVRAIESLYRMLVDTRNAEAKRAK